jgi:hypothetical protein
MMRLVQAESLRRRNAKEVMLDLVPAVKLQVCKSHAGFSDMISQMRASNAAIVVVAVRTLARSARCP